MYQSDNEEKGEQEQQSTKLPQVSKVRKEPDGYIGTSLTNPIGQNFVKQYNATEIRLLCYA